MKKQYVYTIVDTNERIILNTKPKKGDENKNLKIVFYDEESGADVHEWTCVVKYLGELGASR